ncbi:MAG: preprotein translocase subunit SecA, partial [Desulfomonilaceae bacterium]
MFSSLARKLFGSKNDRELKRIDPIVRAVNELEPRMKALGDEEFPIRTNEFKERLNSGQETVDDLAPEAFALVREASIRSLGMRHFDVQLIGGM